MNNGAPRNIIRIYANIINEKLKIIGFKGNMTGT
jgi:hypothetical protein